MVEDRRRTEVSDPEEEQESGSFVLFHLTVGPILTS